jgi:FG-GAP-like repeat
VNHGDGTFEPAPRMIATPDRPYDVDLGDLDGDGDLDVVITCDFDPGQVLLLYNDGKGGLDDRESLFPGGQTFNSVLSDLDQKGGLDLVVARNAAAQLSVYLNLGDGSFSLKGAVPAGTDPKALRAADLNGDGAPDIVSANDTSGRIIIYLGDGAGGLRQRISYQSGVQPRELVILDLDGDKKPDLVVADGRGANYVSRFLGNGDGTFRGPVDFTTGPRPNSVDAADFDGDGKPDVAVANWSLDDPPQASLSVLFGDGAGDFPRKLDLTPPGGFRKITALAVGQLATRVSKFVRGDASGDARLTITDAILILRFLFQSGQLACPDAADVDDGGEVGITDPILLLSWMFQAGAPPAQPFPAPGPDPTPDRLPSCD